MPRKNQTKSEHISKDTVIKILEESRWNLGWRFTNSEKEFADILNKTIDRIINQINTHDKFNCPACGEKTVQARGEKGRSLICINKECWGYYKNKN